MTPAPNQMVEFLTLQGWRLPIVIVFIVGMVLALVTWRRHPGASLLSLIAFVLFLASTLFGALLSWFLFSPGSGLAMGDRAMWTSLGAGFSVLLNIVAWVLLLIALFARRPAESAWAPEDPNRFRRRPPYPGGPPTRPGPPSEEIRQ